MPDDETSSIVYCRSLGKWAARLECGPGCQEPHWIIPVTADQAAAWLNMLIQVRDNLLDRGGHAYWLPTKIDAIIPRTTEKD